TAHEGSEPHARDSLALWTAVLLACSAICLAVMQVPRVWRALTPRSVWTTALYVWTIAALALAAVVLAKPAWFWRFTDSWSGTSLAPAELPWVEAWHLRPPIVLICGSLALIFTALTGAGS